MTARILLLLILYIYNLPISCHTRNQLDKFKSLFDLDLNVPIDNHTNLNENLTPASDVGTSHLIILP